jgi:hypothetical protein
VAVPAKDHIAIAALPAAVAEAVAEGEAVAVAVEVEEVADEIHFSYV